MKEVTLNLFDLIMALATAVDLVSRVVANHHKRVAYIAATLAQELGWAQEHLHMLAVAGALHDIGALSLKERLDTLQFELENPHRHAELGYRFLSRFRVLPAIAPVVRYHHTWWENGRGSSVDGREVPLASHLLHLADRIDILIDPKQHILIQAEAIRNTIRGNSGRMFAPELVTAFERIARREYFWLDAVSPSLEYMVRRRVGAESVVLSLEELLELARLLAHVIDFKSSFTSTHSSGVAASAEVLAGLGGFSSTECLQMCIAGNLHDLGKLAVPAEILEKPTKLDEAEFSVIRGHTYHTRRILDSIGDLGPITDWAASHHERLDGTGYPFHELDADLSLGARMMSVADVFTALTEDRPYRKGMRRQEVLATLEQMAQRRLLDGGIVALLRDNYEKVNRARIAAQKEEAEEYRKIMQLEV